jgi:predicted Zn-dependent protease
MAELSAIALDKCLRSRNPVAVEPGRWTTILEPQAAFDLFAIILGYLPWASALQGYGPFADNGIDTTKPNAQQNTQGFLENMIRQVFGLGEGSTKIGQKLLDERLSIGADPMDPDLGFIPFDRTGEPYQPATWFDHGILTHLSYNRRFAVTHRIGNVGLLNSGAFRVTVNGPTTTIDEMIATTKRGLLVTRFSNVGVLDQQSLLSTGYTRDGVWLVENGKISKAVKNFRFVESPLFAFNQVEQLGTPQRVFYPGSAAIVPAMKINDFSFPSLSDAI